MYTVRWLINLFSMYLVANFSSWLSWLIQLKWLGPRLNLVHTRIIRCRCTYTKKGVILTYHTGIHDRKRYGWKGGGNPITYVRLLARHDRVFVHGTLLWPLHHLNFFFVSKPPCSCFRHSFKHTQIIILPSHVLYAPPYDRITTSPLGSPSLT